MAFGGILSTSLSGLFTNQEALRVTSNNVANANTPGYARQVVHQEANVRGGISAGVKVAEVERVVDRFLEAAILTASGDAERHAVVRDIHDRLQSALGQPNSDSALSARLNSVFKTLGDLALDPADAVLRQQFLSQLDGFAREVSRIAGVIQDLRADASSQITSRLDGVNDALGQVYELNKKIVRQAVLDGDVSGLENERQAALSRIAAHLDVRTIQNADGSIDVLTGSGLQLVARNVLTELEYKEPAAVGADTRFPGIQLYPLDPDTRTRQGGPRPIDGDIRSGALRGLLDMRDKQLVDLSVSLGELAARTADAVNAVHNAHSAVPAPAELVGKATPYAGSDPHNFTGQATFAIVDQDNRVVASTAYDFDANPAATLADVIAAVNAGLGAAGTLSFSAGQMRLTAANSAHGVVVADDGTRPSDRAGRGFSHFFGMNDLLTARHPGIFETGVAPGDAHSFAAGQTAEFSVSAGGRELTRFTLDTAGTATYGDLLAQLNDPTALGRFFSFALDASGAIQISPNSTHKGLQLSVSDDNTNSAASGISFSQMFGIGDRFRAGAATEFRVAERIAGNVSALAVGAFALGTPVGGTALSPGDQAGALALQRLQNQVINSRAAGEVPALARTLGGLNSAVLGNFGLMAARADTAAQDHAALKVEVDRRRSEVSGVNLDEELANLVVYQNAYNAAARILSSVQELYDSLLAAV